MSEFKQMTTGSIFRYIVALALFLVIGAITLPETGAAVPQAKDSSYTFSLIYVKAFKDGEPSVDESLSDIASLLKKSFPDFKRFEARGSRSHPKAKLSETVTVKKHGYQFIMTPVEEENSKVRVMYKVFKDNKNKDQVFNSTVRLKKKTGTVFIKEKKDEYTYLVALRIH